MLDVMMRDYQKVMFVSSLMLPWREPKIISGVHCEHKVVHLCKSKKWEKILFITGPNIYKRGLPVPLIEKLERAGITVILFNETQANPPIWQVENCVSLYHKNACDAIIGFGGGSPIDLAKATGARIARPGKEIPKLKGVLKVLKKTPPLIAIPTTAGSGSETTLAAVITDEKATEKYAINDPRLIPNYAVLNPKYTAGMPPHVTSTTGMDALTHAVEAYIGKSNTAYTRKKAENAVRLILRYLVRAYEDGSDLEARAKIQEAAYDAGCAFTRAYVGYVHALSHALSAFYGTAHGLANAVIMPYVLRAYGKSAHAPLANLARQNSLAGENDSDEKAAGLFIDKICEMNRAMNIPLHLKDIKEEDITDLVAHAIKEANPLYPVPRIMRERELGRLYEQIMETQEENVRTDKKEEREQTLLIEEAFVRTKSFYKTGITHPVAFRKEQLRRLKRTIQERETEIYRALRKDLNKSDAESFMTEISLVLEEITYMLRKLSNLSRAKRKLPGLTQLPASLKVQYEPYGSVLIMSPWNYPFLLTLGPLVDAIAAGNCVVVKPSAYSPATSALLKDICRQAFPAGLVEVVEGGREENQALLDMPFDYIFFTGSPSVGKYVMEKASKRLIPVTLELGGKSPCIVDHTADIKKTAKRILFGKLTNAGQTCVAPDYILVEKCVKQELIKELLKGLEKAFPDKYYVNNNYVKMIQEKHFDRMLELLEGQELIYPERARELFSPVDEKTEIYADKKRRQIMPVLVDEPSRESRLMTEEIFGPILPVISWQTQDELFAPFDKLEKPLALYIFSKDKKLIQKGLRKIQSGGVCINDTLLHMASSKAPFGGVGHSGMGNYHGKDGFYTFSHKRTVLKKWWHFDVPMRHHPFHEKGLRIMEKILR